MQDDHFKELITRAASQDLDALEALLRACHGPLFAALHVLGIPEDDIEDVAQNTILELYRSLNSYRNDQPFLPWMRAIARNVASNYWRSRSRERGRREIFREYIQANLGQDEQVCNDISGRQQQLKGCVEKLQPRQQQIVKLRYMDGMDSNIIAEKLGATAAAVRQTLSRVRDILRDCLQRRIGPLTASEHVDPA